MQERNGRSMRSGYPQEIAGKRSDILVLSFRGYRFILPLDSTLNASIRFTLEVNQQI